ncbi:hypothetical protein PVAP13_6NG361800 [Panicum virgatum]|uniref:Uncharacterized protein n=1 Tax=Panicum virgatum TaxID=38727 RepID=A0A8T0R648_PANVG|nr:hypothetical protein PVAP13_6NG361800 [Panicum virgatum]
MMLRRVASSTPVPEWLEALLSTRFFLACGAHPASPRNECNMFCLECRGAPPPAFCYYCRAHRHASHRVIQIRRSSYHDVVRVSEVEDVLDITGVQTYVINSARVLFLNERPQPRGAGAAAGKAAASPYNCEICGRALLDPFRFCSLGCKVWWTPSGATATRRRPPTAARTMRRRRRSAGARTPRRGRRATGGRGSPTARPSGPDPPHRQHQSPDRSISMASSGTEEE